MFTRRTKPKFVSALPVTINGVMVTHSGYAREMNEDAVAWIVPGNADSDIERGTLAVVADGMGGHAAGEVASRIAADTVRRLYYELEGSPPDVLTACMTAANHAIYERSQSDPACAGMGTTCTVLAIRGGAAFLAHIGDSRAYLLRDGKLAQISEDHSLVAQLVRDGVITAEEAARSPERNVILRALGLEPLAKPSIWQEGLALKAGDALVLCSDGLSDLIDDETIADTVRSLPAAEACQELLEQALAAGGTDNVSVGVFAVLGSAS
jgi:PPM family protein phosphatase